MRSEVERELKFDVQAGFVVPDVSSVVPAGGRTETSNEQLLSDYFDTADHALLNAGVTLRRRTGTADTGWQLKIPHAPFREEIGVGPQDPGDTVPADVLRLLAGITRGQSLHRVVTVRTERSVTRLLDPDSATLVDIDDDTVHASVSGSLATASQWREVEVELGAGQTDSALLYQVGKRLRRAGATASAASSKLARALAAADPSATTSPLPTQRPANSRPTSAGDVILRYLAEQQHMILMGDLALRRGDDSMIHKTRVATRRLRSTLRVYRRLFESERTAHLDAELRWYASLLGEVRDRQVLHKRLDAMIGAVDETLLLGPVRTRVETELRQEQTERWDTLQHEIIGDRYLQLLDDIGSWVSTPPVTASAAKRARTLTTPLRRAEKQVGRRLVAANASTDMNALHGARKAAKRARYAAEAARPVIGAKASARHASRYQQLQDLLGKYQDSLVGAELLRRLGAKVAPIPGENGFAFGILHERETQAADIARTEARRAAHRYS